MAGVTINGFVPKTFSDLRKELVDSLESKFGKIRSDSESKFGMLADIVASKHADLWALAHDVYNSNAITASGTALDDIVYWSGLHRLPATKSGLYIVMYGDNGTEVPAGTIVRCVRTGSQFESVGTWLIQSSSIGACQVRVIFPNNYIYLTFTITINNSETLTYTTPISGMSKDLITSQLCVAVNLADSNFVRAVKTGEDTFELISKDFTNSSISITLSNSLEMVKFGTAIPFTAQEYGQVPAPVGDATVVVTPVNNVDEAYNYEEARLGRTIETDTELRTRFLQTRSAYGRSTVDAIRNTLLQDVENIIDAVVYENETDTTNADGLPPHSVMAVVDCPTTVEQSVADVLWRTKAGGIMTHGTISKDIEDTQGNIHIVKFSKITTKYAHVNVVITPSSEVSFPSDGLQLIQSEILAFGKTLKLGNDMIYQAFYRPIYSVPGVHACTLGIAVTNTENGTPTYQSSSISVDKTTKLVFAVSRIHVSLT